MLLVKAVEKAVELDCDIRWSDIAEHLAEGAGEEEGSAAGGGSQDGELLFERLAAEDAHALQQYGDDEAIFGMEEAVEHLHLAASNRRALSASSQPGAHLTDCCLLFLHFMHPGAADRPNCHAC
jgi:hypothetical protein